MSKVKLLIIIDEMEVGGTQTQIVQMLSHIDKECYEPTVVYFRSPSFLVDELEQQGVRIVHIQKRSKLDAGFLWRLCYFLRTGDFDVVHCYSFTAELWGMVAHRMVGRGKFISSIRGIYEWHTPIQWHIKRLVSRYSSIVIANSRAGAHYAAMKMRLKEANIAVVYNGIEPPEMLTEPQKREIRQKFQLENDTKVGIFVGRLVEHKNLPSLLRAVTILQSQRKDFMVLIVGSGPLRLELEGMVSNLRLSSLIRMLGERRDAAWLIQASDFVVLPSFREGLSNAILEGMIAGKPVVATAVGGNPELIIHGETGFLYPTDDYQALAKYMSFLLDDGYARKKMGDTGRQHVLREFGIDRMVRQMEQVYARGAYC
jgi:glycosyltransferase involved in cell wall biosynthesis